MAKKSSKAPAQTVEIDIVSDFVCPWCWLGFKQFRAAQKQSKIATKLSFRPYMLDPTVPDEGVDYKSYMQQKFGDGPSDKFKAMREHLETTGPDYGIAFDFKAITRRPNTLGAHRLMRWAMGQDVGDACAEALFTAYMERGQDIGDPGVLSDIAVQVGLDGALVTELLASDKDKIDIQNEIMFFRGLGISGVPTFIYNGQFAVQGAQEPKAHMDAITQAKNTPPNA